MNNKAIQILRSSYKSTDNKIKEEKLLDGQLFYSKANRQLYIGDNSNYNNKSLGEILPIGSANLVPEKNGALRQLSAKNVDSEYEMGENAVSFGEDTSVTSGANNSIAAGKNSTIAGKTSFAFGENLSIKKDNQFVIGKYNDDGGEVASNDGESQSDVKSLFVIGDGDSTNRHNILSVEQGKVTLSDATIHANTGTDGNITINTNNFKMYNSGELTTISLQNNTFLIEGKSSTRSTTVNTLLKAYNNNVDIGPNSTTTIGANTSITASKFDCKCGQVELSGKSIHIQNEVTIDNHIRVGTAGNLDSYLESYNGLKLGHIGESGVIGASIDFITNCPSDCAWGGTIKCTSNQDSNDVSFEFCNNVTAGKADIEVSKCVAQDVNAKNINVQNIDAQNINCTECLHLSNTESDWTGALKNSSIKINKPITNTSFTSWIGMPTYDCDTDKNEGGYLGMGSLNSGKIIAFGYIPTATQPGTGNVGLKQMCWNADENSLTCDIFRANSDIRLKENITPYKLGEKSILDLPTYEFNYKNNGAHTIGCIAQDLQEICPQIVSEGLDGYLRIEESKIVYLLLEEVKKLRSIIERGY